MIRIVAVILLSAAFVGCAPTPAPQFVDGPETMHTRSYAMSLLHDCPEGCVSCNKIRLVLLNKRTGEVRALSGATRHTVGADGVTPSGFLGYTFTRADRTYWVRDGLFQILDGRDVVLVEEPIEEKTR